MSELKVIVAIGDPWELGEAMGWKKPLATLCVESRESGRLLLQEALTYKGSNHVRFAVRTRHYGADINNVSDDSVACNFESSDGDDVLRFTGSISLA